MDPAQQFHLINDPTLKEPSIPMSRLEHAFQQLSAKGVLRETEYVEISGHLPLLDRLIKITGRTEDELRAELKAGLITEAMVLDALDLIPVAPKFVAIWSIKAQEYKWYDKPDGNGELIEGTDGTVTNVYAATGETLTREDGERATVYVLVPRSRYFRSSKYFAHEAAPDFGSVKEPAKPVCPKFMKNRHKLLRSLRCK